MFFLFDQWRKSLLKNESMSWMGSIDSKKMKESFLLSRKYFQSLTSFTFLGKNIKSLCMLSKKRSILLVWFLSFPNFAFKYINDFAQQWGKKQRRQKKEKGAFKLFFVASCLYATFFNLRAPSLFKKLSFALSPPKKMKSWD